MNPPINPANSSDEGEQNNFESADENELVSPNRPHQSPSASPRALLRPDPPPVEEVLQGVEQQLRDLPPRDQRAANRNAVRQARAAAEAAAEAAAAAAAANIMPNPPAVVDFDLKNGEDGDKAADLARSIKVEFNPHDIKFWFAELEDEMLVATIKSQYLKKSVLQRNLPVKQKEDVKAYLTLSKTEAGDSIYHDIKAALIRIYAPRPQDSYNKALTRTMVGLPSQLGYQIVDDICKKPNKLVGCCCAAAALALWSLQLPVNVRAHISNSEFTAATYRSVFEAADRVFLSSKQISVAAIAGAKAANLDETQSAFSPQNQPQVAAVSSGGGGKKNKKNKNKNRNQNGQAQGQGGQGGGRGPRHSSNPPDSCCDRHFRHGDLAWYCLAPTTCPWANKVTARPSSSSNK